VTEIRSYAFVARNRCAAESSSPLSVWTVVAALVAILALMSTVGADSLWLAALGRVVAGHGVPAGVPFAAAPSGHWANVPVLAELAFHGLEAAAGDRGLLLAQLVAIATAFVVLARTALGEDAEPGAVAATLVLAAAGGAASLIVIRAQLFSLVLFPILIALLRGETARPSRRIWLVVPLIALWSNLHGAVLVGLAVTLAYLLLGRSVTQPVVAAAVALCTGAAVFATPALLQTLDYYRGVSTNAAAARGYGLWAGLSLRSPFDLLLATAAALLLAAFVRSRPRLWEAIVAAVLAALTVHAGRFGIWLLFFLVVPAARAVPLRVPRLRGPAFLACTAFAVLAAVAGPARVSVGPVLLERTLAAAGGRPVLAEPALSERLALAGGRVWIGDPIDAFARADQDAYLAWLTGDSGTILGRVQFALVQRGSAADRLVRANAGFVRVAGDARALLYRRRSRDSLKG
jgi:hypothetical protein